MINLRAMLNDKTKVYGLLTRTNRGPCKTCGGTGQVSEDNEYGTSSIYTCSTCHGLGYTETDKTYALGAEDVEACEKIAEAGMQYRRARRNKIAELRAELEVLESELS